MKYLTYNPEQGYLLPPSVREVLGDDHVCFFVHRAVERLDLSAFEQGYVEGCFLNLVLLRNDRNRRGLPAA